MEQQALWEQISAVFRTTVNVPNRFYAAMGPDPNLSPADHVANGRYEPWFTEPVTLRCPSDPGQGLPAAGRTNYAFCIGDAIVQTNFGPETRQGVVNAARSNATRASCRGVFVSRMVTSLKDVLDGLANTIAMGEINTDLGDFDITTFIAESPVDLNTNPNHCASFIDPARPTSYRTSTPRASAGTFNLRGYKWSCGRAGYTKFQTILPPNSQNCAYESVMDGTIDLADDGVYSASSRHQGGCHVLMADGAVKFISESIEAGDSTHRPVRIGGMAADPTLATNPGAQSPYGLWGALGTRAAKEVIDEEF
jgi:prepilin-type processing-associated H-X9-DG protein